MKILVSLAITVSLLSCGSKSAVSKVLEGADSLVIDFTNQDHAVTRTVSTAEPKAIEKLSRFVDGKKTLAYKCGYNGELRFYRSGGLLANVSFSFGEGCKHFFVKTRDEILPTEMNNEASDFLKALSEGKDWY